MKNNWTKIGIGRIALAAVLVATIGGALAQGNGSNQPSGQAGGTGTSNVVVTNAAAQPVPVKEQNNPAFQPFQWQQGVSMLGASFSYSFTIPVPAGKRLVVEMISGYFAGSTNGSIPRMSLQTHLSGALSAIWVPLSNVGWDGYNYQYNASQPVRMYADGGTNMTVFVSKSAEFNGQYTSPMSGAITVTGYLVNIP